MGIWRDPIFQLLLNSLGLVFLREGLCHCHCAAVQFDQACLNWFAVVLGTQIKQRSQVVLQELPLR